MLVPISMSQNFPRQQVAGAGVPSTVTSGKAFCSGFHSLL